MTRPDPYIRGPVTLHLGDCLEILPGLGAGSVDAVVTDPPYGTGWYIGGGARAGEFKAVHCHPEWDQWDTDWIQCVSFKSFACFCPDYRIPELMNAVGKCRLRYYVKSNPRPPLNGRDAPSIEPIVIWPSTRNSSGASHRVAYNGDARHPCQKPESIMEWLVADMSDSDWTILDPFTGSGTTAIACIRTGRRFIGCEIDPKYWELACARIDRELDQGNLFEPRAERQNQRQLELIQ